MVVVEGVAVAMAAAIAPAGAPTRLSFVRFLVEVYLYSV
jgi:hypothetical protein